MVQAIFEGNIGRISDLQETKNGKKVINVALVNSPREKQADGTWIDGEGIWKNVTIWGDEAENFANSGLKNGDRILVVGNERAQKSNAYTKADGTEVPAGVEVTLNADTVAVVIGKFNTVGGFIRKTNNSNNGGGASTGGNAEPASKKTPTSLFDSEDDF